MMLRNSHIQAKYLFYESVKANKYADWVYDDLQTIIEAQDDVEGGRSPGWYLRRVTEHLVKAILYLNEWRAATEHGEHEAKDILAVNDLIDKLRILTHTSYRIYMLPIMEGWQALKAAHERMADYAKSKREKALRAAAKDATIKKQSKGET